MELDKFMEVVNEIARQKYHVGVTVGYDYNGVAYVESWSIYRCDMPMKEYFSMDNKPVLCSENKNTLEDIKKLIEMERRRNEFI